MKTLIAILAFLSLSQARAQGQAAQVQEVGEDSSTASENTVIVPSQPTAEAEVQVQPSPAATGSNPIYILNNQRYQGYQGSDQRAEQRKAPSQTRVTQTVVQEQPDSVVQDTPLKNSPAGTMRKHRQEAESGTEDGIVQTLERARIEDEMKRRDRFNNAIVPVASDSTTGANANKDAQVTAPPIVVLEPVRQTKKVVRVVDEEDDDSNTDTDIDQVAKRPTRKSEKNRERADQDEKVDIRGEIRAAMEESRAKNEHSEERPEARTETYVSGIASFGAYDKVVNVNNSLGYGIAVGMQTAERFVVEGSFLYGNYELEDIYGTLNYGYPVKVNMRQYNVNLAAKYAILPGKFRPLIGALLGYTRRNYDSEGYEFRTSDAVDVGALFGADLVVSSNFAVGVDLRYMTNLGYRQNLNQNQSLLFSQRRNDPERLDYYTLNLIAKYMF